MIWQLSQNLRQLKKVRERDGSINHVYLGYCDSQCRRILFLFSGQERATKK